MPLDPQAQAIADVFSQRPPPDFATLTVSQYRNFLTAFPAFAPQDNGLVSTENGTVGGADGPLKMRLYRPAVAGPLALTVYFHGGGFVSCGLDTHDNICSRLAAQTGSLVVSVDYRLAPEHPFPAGVNDAVAATRWLYDHAATLGADASRIAVAGDSAGATLATVVAHQLHGKEMQICHQLLLYPVTDSACDSPSQLEMTQTPILTSHAMRWFWQQYLPDAPSGLDPRASPLRQIDLQGSPSATIITAEVDPLRDEGEAYAQALAKAGVCVTQRRWPGQFHGFASLLGTLDAADDVLAFSAQQLRQAFAFTSADQDSYASLRKA